MIEPPKQKPQTSKKYRAIKFVSVLLVPVFVSSTALFTPVLAATYQEQINQLRQQNSQAQGNLNALEVQEGSLSVQIANLQAEIASLEQQIRDSNAKREDVLRQIAEAEDRLAEQRRVLAQNIKRMYVEGDISTMEMLASSNNLSDFVDKQQYRESVQSKVTEILNNIKTLKAQLDAQRAEVERLLADQEGMKAQADVQRAEANRLLSLNQDQQAAVERDIRNNNAQISDLQRKQAQENRQGFVGGWTTGGTGGYPWVDAPFPNSMVDPWGMYKRQCVSYTAWKVANSGRHMPYWGGRGNAKQWDDNARAAGIPVDTNPRVGDVAVSNAGTYGHVMYVEAVHGDGTITISQYNANWDGRYSTGRRSTAGLVFIHF